MLTNCEKFQNGSGKSAIMAAIILGFGGKASDTVCVNLSLCAISELERLWTHFLPSISSETHDQIG